MTNIDPVVQKLYSGKTFTLEASGVAQSGDTVSAAIENPSDSGRVLTATDIVVTTNGGAEGTLYRNPDISSSTSNPPKTDKIGSGETSVATGHEDGSYSNADSTETFPISNGNKDSSGLAERPPMSITEDASLALEVESTSNDNNYLIEVVFYETGRKDTDDRL